MKRKLDVTDILILQLLQQNCYASNKEISVLINKSDATTSSRIRRLKDDGYIVKMVAILDPKLLGNDVIGFINLNLADVSEEAISSFRDQLTSIHGICECYKTVGQYDVLIKIITRNLETFEQIQSKISRLKCITNMSSHCATSTIIQDKGIDCNLD